MSLAPTRQFPDTRRSNEAKQAARSCRDVENVKSDHEYGNARNTRRCPLSHGYRLLSALQVSLSTEFGLMSD